MKTPRQIREGSPHLRRRRAALAKLIDAGNVLCLSSLSPWHAREWEAALKNWEYAAATIKEPSK